MELSGVIGIPWDERRFGGRWKGLHIHSHYSSFCPLMGLAVRWRPIGQFAGSLCAAQAPPATPPKDVFGGPGGYFRYKTVLAALDTNHDNAMSPEEMANATERMHGMFDRGDADKDGFLTKAEIDRLEASMAPPKGNPQRERTGPPGGFIRQDPMLIPLDTDHNGEISTEEMENAPLILKKLDRNGDGRLTETNCGRGPPP